MKPTARFFTALSFCIAIAARPPQAFAADVSVQEYRQQVSDLRTRVDSLKTHPEQAGELLNSIPDEQTVRAGKDDIAVSYRTLKNELTAFSADAEHKPDRLDRISNYLQTLESEADN
jgi:predicted  nucleic acid-binding Zn-ribbon protein